MEIKELISFVSVVQQGNFSRAGRKIGYSQAAITIQIQSLEKKLGIRLFDRFGKKIVLTNRGRQFYEKIIPVLNSLAEAGESVRLQNNLCGKLVIGASDSVCMSVLPDLIRKYHQSYPDVSVKIVTDTNDGLLKMLNQNDVDFVFLDDQKIYGKNWLTLFETESRVRFIAGNNHEVIDKKPMLLEELLSFPFILPEENVSYRRLFDRELQGRGLEVKPVMEANHAVFILAMLLEGQEISFLPEYLLENRMWCHDLRILEVPDCQISVCLQILCHKNKWVSQEMSAFFDMM